MLDDASAKCWGNNDYSQLGFNDGTIDVGAERGVVAISAGAEHTCVLDDYGSAKCWGRNQYGQLGYGDASSRGDGAEMSAIDVGGGRSVMSISAGAYHTCAVLDGGTAKCWGGNMYGQLGYGDQTNRGDDQGEMGASLQAIDVGEGRTVVSISAGLRHT